MTPIEASGAPEQGDKAQVEGGPGLPLRGVARQARRGRALRGARGVVEPQAHGTVGHRGAFLGGGAPRRRSPTQRRGRSAAPDRGSSRSRGLTGWKRRRKFDLSLVLGRGAYTTFRDVTLASSLYFLVFQFVKLSS